MCGQIGVIFGAKHRTRDEIDYLTWLFTRVLELSEERGPYATGVAWLNRDGEHRLFKKVVPASEFIRDKAFGEVLGTIDNSVTVLLGHTRWPTRGNPACVDDAQPKRAGRILATHNGTVTNADWLFQRFGLPRHAEVDSEVIFRFADESIDADGRLNLHALAGRMALCKGSVAAVMVAKTDPERVVMIRGTNPLEMMYSPRYRAVLYASDMDYIRHAVGDETGWVEAAIPRGALVAVGTDPLEIAEAVRVERKVISAVCL